MLYLRVCQPKTTGSCPKHHVACLLTVVIDALDSFLQNARSCLPVLSNISKFAAKLHSSITMRNVGEISTLPPYITLKNKKDTLKKRR